MRLHAKVLKGKLRGSTDHVLTNSLPRILLDDTINMPRQLCFEPVNVNVRMVRKGLRLMAEEVTMVRVVGGIYYVLRFKSKFDKLTLRLVRDYKDTMVGTPPSRSPDYVNAPGGTKEELLALIDICQSMHSIMVRGSRPLGTFVSSLLNPAELVCTCKGFRMTSTCAHIVAITALFITDAMCVPGKTSFDQTYLETLVEKVSAVSRASHRPRNTVGGSHIQPRDDTVEDDEDSEEDDGDCSDDEDLTNL